jgi:hypothetical protein
VKVQLNLLQTQKPLVENKCPRFELLPLRWCLRSFEFFLKVDIVTSTDKADDGISHRQ